MRINRRNLPLNALRAFEAAARHCHLRSAAEELGVTQGAVSQQVRSLEELLEVQLFQRENRRLALTPVGKRLLGSVREGLDRITEGVLHLDPESMAGELSVASTPSILNNLLMPVIGRFSSKYPEVTVRAEQISPREMELPEDLDVIVCYGKPVNKELQLRKIYDTIVFPVASPTLFADGKSPQKLDDLLNYPLLHDRTDPWGMWFNAYGVKEAKSRISNIYYRDAYQAIMAARLGQGLAMAELYEVAADLAAGRLMRPLDQSVDLTIGGYLALPPAEQQSLRAKVFVEELENTLKEIRGYFQLGVTGGV